MASAEGKAPKRARVDDECVIHSPSEEVSAPLVQLKDSDSWQTLLKAATIRNHERLLSIAESLTENELPSIKYHSKCRKLFTMKKSLESIERKMSETAKSTESTPQRKSIRPQPSKSPVYDAICILCEKKTKYLKGSKTRDVLQQCVTKEADAALRDAAIQKLDNRVIAILSREAVASEVHFHRSCYRVYTKLESESSEQQSPCTENRTEEQYSDIETKAFKEVCDFVRNNLFENPRPIMLSDLRMMLIDHMKILGCASITDSTRKNFRRKLEAEFQDTIHIVSDGKGWLIIYPDTLLRDKLVCDFMKLKHELEILNANVTDNSVALAKAAVLLHNDILAQHDNDTWPPNIDKMNNENTNVPESVTVFYRTLIKGSKTEELTASVERQINSFGQDVIYAVTKGRRQPPKHVLIPLVVKSLTGNVELVRILNRLGHCMSYSAAEEIETALCIQKLQSAPEQGVALPANIHPNICTTVVWDNIDRIEETLSGGGTSHRVNGIVIQPKVFGPQTNSQTVGMKKGKQRSIDILPEAVPYYNAGNRTGPPVTLTEDAQNFIKTTETKQKNHLWAITRHVRQNIPSWTGFNIKVSDNSETLPDEVGYLPTINAPATELSTVFEILTQSNSIMKTLQLPYIVCVFDQALYAKAVEITWKHPDMFKNLVLRMGDFHMVFNYMAAIGKRFQDAGLRDLAVESGVIAEGAAQGVMDGRLYNRAIRFHKLVYEALLQLAWKAFPSWLLSNHPDHEQELTNALQYMVNQDEIGSETIPSHLQNSWQSILSLFDSFLGQLRAGISGNLASFWVSYIDMVEIMLGLVRAAREGDWELHLLSVRAMIPWLFACDKLNYARYVPFYYAAMTQLDHTHPGLTNELQQGRFSVQISTNQFSKIPADQAIEETVNRDTQTAGGTKGFSLKPEAVFKYYVSAEYRSSALRQLRFMVEPDQHKKSIHTDLQNSRIMKDNQDVDALIDTLENAWIDPMSGHHDLVCISTGRLASTEVTNDLIQAHAIGEQMYQTFKQQRLESLEPTTKFHDRMSKAKLKTFTDMTKKKTMTVAKGKDVIMQADRSLFRQMILAAQSRLLDIRSVLSHPLGPMPWALATADGSLRKTNKCTLAKTVEGDMPVADVIPTPSACIIDGMSLLQKAKGEHRTFGHLAQQVLTSVLLDGADSDRIDVVFDVYKTSSIKNAERTRRGSEESIRIRGITSGQTIHQWHRFLTCAENKTNLVEYLVKEWCSPISRARLNGKTVFVTCDTQCYRITQDASNHVPVLWATHEEADTRVMLHAKHASDEGYAAVVINAEDTDIFVLALAFSHAISCSLYQKKGTQRRRQFIDINKVAAKLGPDISKALVGLHAYTGCDSVSAFVGKGKVKPLKLMQNSPDFVQCFLQLGQAWDLTQELFHEIEMFTCKLYLPAVDCDDINECRYLMFCTQRGEVDSSQLPPCRDTLFQHTLRANYQAAIWRRSMAQDMNVPDPCEFGWHKCDDHILGITWMTGLPAPETVLDLLKCTCRKSCELPHCSCKANGLNCTLMCKLQDCGNMQEDVLGEPDINNVIDDENDDEYVCI